MLYRKPYVNFLESNGDMKIYHKGVYSALPYHYVPCYGTRVTIKLERSYVTLLR